MNVPDWKFVAEETRRGARRQVPMLVALTVVVAVALSLVGGSWLLSRKVADLKGYWYDKVEVTVFLCGAGSQASICPQGPADDADRAEVEQALEALPVTEKVYYESQDDAWDRFREQYAGSPMLEQVDASAMPEAYRVKLHDPTRFDDVAAAVANHPAVESVQDQRALLSGFFALVTNLQLAAIALAVSQAAVAALLVGATVRMAVHTRRREVEMLRLIGASNALIRAPFLGEVAIAGLAGALVSVGVLAVMQQLAVDMVILARAGTVPAASWTDLAVIGPILLAAGLLIPVAAAAAALRKHLRT